MKKKPKAAVGDRYDVVLTDGGDQMNSLLQTSNDTAAANLEATRGLGSALSSGRFAQGMTQTLIRERNRSATGNRGLI
jgi:hypothetical protein